MASEVSYKVDYDDKRFQDVQADKKAALTDVEKTYGGMIGESDKYYQAQIDASKQWADTQTHLQQEKTDFAIQEINQQKDQAHKDYIKEQSGAYTDWQKQSNEYGANAEKEAMMGMSGTGYSESSQVSMYNTYQNRVATAREAYVKAVQGYDNAITQARLQNNSVLAEIAYNSLQKQLELSLQGFQYKNNLILEQANKKQEIDNTYYRRYQDVLNQINTENALAEEVRQYNQNYKLEMDKFQEEIRQYNEEIARLKAKDAQEYELEIKNLQLQRDKLTEEARQFDEALKKSSSGGGGGGSGGGSGGSGGGSSGSTKTIAMNKPASQQTADESKTMASIMALGYGAISEAKLNQLVASGEVEEYTVNGVTLFRKKEKKLTTKNYSPTKQALSNGKSMNFSSFDIKARGTSGKF